MKIAFYGSSLLSSYWNGAATYYRGLLKDLAHRGHEITFYEPDAFDRQKHRDIDPPDWATSVVYHATEQALRARHRRGGAGATSWSRRAASASSTTSCSTGAHARRPARRDPIFWDVDAPATLAEMRGCPRPSAAQRVANRSTSC